MVDIKIKKQQCKKRKFTRKIIPITEKISSFKIPSVRLYIQIGFLLVILWIGIEFILFVHQLEKGVIPAISRPPGVEGFLPISALISLKYWLLTGIFNNIHPSALILLLIILASAFILKKGFCSWVCPVGFISEGLVYLHKKLFDRQMKLSIWLDYPLRSIKYLLMIFFVWTVFVQMNISDLHQFIYSPYNKVADIKMLKFFINMSSTTFWVLVMLLVLSLAVPYFWCRYLCPYGALLGGISWSSLFKIHRNKDSCIDCEECTRVCPANVKVHKLGAVWSDECHACLNCVDACPVNNTLYFSFLKRKLKLNKKLYAILIVLFFVIGTSLARVFGVWQNNISTSEYQHHIQLLNDPAYQHNRGQVPDYDEGNWNKE